MWRNKCTAVDIPLGCAAALASLDLFAQDKLLDHVAEMAPRLRKGMEPFRSLPHVGDVRGIGMVAALELVEDKDTRKPFPDGHPIMRKICQEGLQMGLILRPLGNIVYLMLPLCTTADELDDIIKNLEITLQETLILQ